MQFGTPQHWQAQPPMADLPRRSSGNAIASFVPGLLSIFCFSALTGTPGLICVFMAPASIKKQPDQLTGRGFANPITMPSPIPIPS